jgi:hypothetical protein
MINTECEWNPRMNRYAFKGEHQVTATWKIGGKQEIIFLCDECVKLDKFKKKTKRQKIININD